MKDEKEDMLRAEKEAKEEKIRAEKKALVFDLLRQGKTTAEAESILKLIYN